MAIRSWSLGLIVAAELAAPGAWAGPWEDGMAAYNRGDYAPAVEIFRPLARAGNARAEALLGTMYRRGQGVAQSSGHAFIWLSLAARHGDANAKAELGAVEASMSAAEVARSRQLMQGCEASNYRDCAY